MSIPKERVGAVPNAMTVDVEDYYQVSAFEGRISRCDWSSQPSRVEASTDRVLDLFASAGIQATFFTLGWIGEQLPGMVRRVAAAGHEVASHGYDHVRATSQNRAEFTEDVRRTKGILEDVVGAEVRGYRAPSFSLDATNLWVWDALEEAGYAYSSSVYPIRHDHYGLPNAPRGPFLARPGGMREIPIGTVRLLGMNWPCGGGGYFRLMPYWYSTWALRRLNESDGLNGVFYIHPWELDPDQPRQTGLNWKTRIRHYTNLKRMEARLARLLKAFSWSRMDTIFLDKPITSPTRELTWVPEI